jgi:hypothetical protein
VSGGRAARAWFLGASADRIAILAAACFTVAAVLLGAHTGYRTVDVDEAVFFRTVVAMRAGDGYYPAMRDALTHKEGRGPSQIRSVRPPTLYLFLARFPPGSWRYVVGTVYLTTLLLAWRLARGLHPLGGPIAVLLTGMWALGAAPYLFLHTELWGVPFLLAGALALRNDRWAAAAVALAAAALLRELYVPALLLGMLLAPRRRAFAITAVAVAGIALLHAGLASGILTPGGREPALGLAGHGSTYLLSALSPSDRPLGWIIGVAGTVLGFVGLSRRWGDDAAARLLLPFAEAMVVLTVFVGRNYWGLAFGPALACFAPAGLAAVQARYLASTSARNLPV